MNRKADVNESTAVLTYPYGTAEVSVVVGGNLDQPLRVIKNMLNVVVSTNSVVAEQDRIFDSPDRKLLMHKPCITRIDFAGITFDITIIVSLSSYVDRGTLAREVFDLISKMTAAAGLEIQNTRQVPAAELTSSEKRAAFQEEVFMFDTAHPGGDY